jgi:hypothetical protein
LAPELAAVTGAAVAVAVGAELACGMWLPKATGAAARALRVRAAPHPACGGGAAAAPACASCAACCRSCAVTCQGRADEARARRVVWSMHPSKRGRGGRTLRRRARGRRGLSPAPLAGGPTHPAAHPPLGPAHPVVVQHLQAGQRRQH